jgi:hypothetical protein
MKDLDTAGPSTGSPPVCELLCRNLSIPIRRIACAADAIELPSLGSAEGKRGAEGATKADALPAAAPHRAAVRRRTGAARRWRFLPDCAVLFPATRAVRFFAGCAVFFRAGPFSAGTEADFRTAFLPLAGTLRTARPARTELLSSPCSSSSSVSGARLAEAGFETVGDATSSHHP